VAHASSTITFIARGRPGTPMDMPRFRTWLLPLFCLAIPLSVGIVGSFFTGGSITGWYAGLNKPAINPPAWVFGPVWTLLYILMGISLYLILRYGTERTLIQRSVLLFAAQLALNFLCVDGLLWGTRYSGSSRGTPFAYCPDCSHGDPVHAHFTAGCMAARPLSRMVLLCRSSQCAGLDA